MNKSPKFSPEVHEHAVRMVQVDHVIKPGAKEVLGGGMQKWKNSRKSGHQDKLTGRNPTRRIRKIHYESIGYLCFMAD